MARKQLEEKKYKDELEAAQVFEKFIETFQNPDNNTSLSKTWVRGNVYKSQSDEKSNLTVEAMELYKPSPVSILKLNQVKCTADKTREYARILPFDTKSNQSLEKKKSNLESLKEELELLHNEKLDKRNYMEQIKSFCAIQSNVSHKSDSTNLFVNNINFNITERILTEIFGKYGAIANVKIMWPRSEKDKVKTTNCGFVAYMSRKDAERALIKMNGKIFMGCKLEIDWSKPILLPHHPIYVPAVLLELSNPPPSTGLPFNAQPPRHMRMSVTTMDEYLSYCTVQVSVPRDKHILALIHRTIEYVIREGPLFEAIIMTKEINNKSYRFLFDNYCAEHVYYRWKLYTILQGESINEWSMKPFRMFEEGSIWKPPINLNYSQGMSELLINMDEKRNETLRKSLSIAQRDHLERLIHKLTPEKNKVAECLVFCMNHSRAYEEISECISQSLEKKSTLLWKIIGRLYLISDILCNCKHIEPSFQNIFEKYLPNIMKTLYEIYGKLTYQAKQLLFSRIMRILTAWKYKMIYPVEYLEYLYCIFTTPDETGNFQSDMPENIQQISTEQNSNETEKVIQRNDKEIDKEYTDIQTNSLPGFIVSRWETVDPDIVESQAMTSSKWPDYFIKDNEPGMQSKDISEEKQKKLPEIEIKLMKYQDKLESRQALHKSNKTIMEQVEEYRNELITKLELRIKKNRKK